jgi:hypothetical protein
MEAKGRYLRCVLKKQPQKKRENRVSLLLGRLFRILAN